MSFTNVTCGTVRHCNAGGTLYFSSEQRCVSSAICIDDAFGKSSLHIEQKEQTLKKVCCMTYNSIAAKWRLNSWLCERRIKNILHIIQFHAWSRQQWSSIVLLLTLLCVEAFDKETKACRVSLIDCFLS